MGQFIVLDLEWNQSPAGKEGSMNRLPFEIIEIGAVKLNKNLQISKIVLKYLKICAHYTNKYLINEGILHM